MTNQLRWCDIKEPVYAIYQYSYIDVNDNVVKHDGTFVARIYLSQENKQLKFNDIAVISGNLDCQKFNVYLTMDTSDNILDDSSEKFILHEIFDSLEEAESKYPEYFI